jgi:hypothetical protein
MYDGSTFRNLNVIDESHRESLLIECSISIALTRLVRVMELFLEVHGKKLK